MFFLQVLNFDSNQFKSKSIRQITDTCLNLTELNLRNTWLSRRSVEYLAKNLTTNIEKLNLETLKPVDDEIVKKLATRFFQISYF